MSISEREIWACAHEVIRQHGDNAAWHAAQRADELIARSDLGGQRVWLRILRRINELESMTPQGDLN